MTPNEIADCRTDLLTFVRTMFRARKGADFVTSWHHEIICEALEKAIIGKTKRLIINIPPRYSKTEIAVINFIAWCMGNFPDCEFITASYSKRLASTSTWSARNIIQHEKYKEIFGDIGITKDSNAKDEWRTESGGCVYAAGTEGTITGYGAGKMRDYFGGAIIIDDPHKAGEANSDTMRQNVIDWFNETMESRTNSKETPIIIIMQRLHEEDLSGYLLAGGNGEKWEHICLPVLNDKDEPLWPFKHTREDLRRIETSNSYVFAGQYLQLPSPKGGGIFKTEWWRYYRALPTIKYRKIYADTAQKTKDHNDYSVFQCWGYGEDGKIYLLDQLRGKWEAPQLLTSAKLFWNKHKGVKDLGALREFKVEDKSSGTGLIQQLKQTGIPIKGIPRSIDKITRYYDIAPQIEVGNVVIPENEEWVLEYTNEFEKVPNGKNDDQIDPTADAIQDMLIKGNSKIFIG